MITAREGFIQQGKLEGKFEGMNLSKAVIQALKKQQKPEEIARNLNIPINQVLDFKGLLGL